MAAFASAAGAAPVYPVAAPVPVAQAAPSFQAPAMATAPVPNETRAAAPTEMASEAERPARSSPVAALTLSQQSAEQQQGGTQLQPDQEQLQAEQRHGQEMQLPAKETRGGISTSEAATDRENI